MADERFRTKTPCGLPKHASRPPNKWIFTDMSVSDAIGYLINENTCEPRTKNDER